MPLTLEQINAASPPRPPPCWTACTNTRPGSPSKRWRGPFARWRTSSTRWHRSCATPGASAARADPRPPRTGRQGHGEQHADRRIDHEQSKAGLTDCTPEEFARIQQLNADYNAKFGFPFILAVRGPRGTGLTKREIIDTFARRLDNHPDFERPSACATSTASLKSA
jgi:N-carbamoyl-L-amino-acid hydrolase